MTMHKETVQVPDGYTIDTCPCTWPDYVIQYRLKPVPPPEPPILPCPFCGKALEIKESNGEHFIYHGFPDNCVARFTSSSMSGYPTRLAAIEAANRRSGT